MTDLTKPTDLDGRVWAESGAVTSPTTPEVVGGWAAGEKPPAEWFNYLQNRTDKFLSYLIQKGIPEWDINTNFIASKSFVAQSGNIYVAKLSHTGQSPALDVTFVYWKLILGNTEVLYKPEVVTNVAALRLVSSVAVKNASTRGYYTAGDGGHGSYWYDAADTSSADNGFTVIVGADGARWKLHDSNGYVFPEQAGAVGDGVTDDTLAMTNLLVYCNNISTNNIYLSKKYLVDAGVIAITRNGLRIIGSGVGNVANLTPSAAQKAELIIKGAGAGIRVKSQDVNLSGFRLTSDAAREALVFDINSPGVRVEPEDTGTARADRCHIDIRIDKQPGDGVLTVGSALYANVEDCDIYECKGFGVRLDSGRHPLLTRTNKHYPGLASITSCRIGYCGGHAIAASHPDVTTQAEMAIRVNVFDVDSFGNGINHSIMYPSADGIYYDMWLFGENCEIKASAPSGRQGLALTPEINGGIWIAGRDNKLTNNRYVFTVQPIYYGHISAQPSSGLDVGMMRVVNTITHTDCIKVQSASSTGLRVTFDRYENFTNIVTARVGAVFVDRDVVYQGNHQHVSGLSNTGEEVLLLDDTVHVIPIAGLSGGVSAQALLVITLSSVTSGGGIFHVRINTSSPIATKWAGEANTIAYAAGGALTGTTGIDGGINVSSDATNIYIENRRGFTVTMTYQILSIKRGLALSN